MGTLQPLPSITDAFFDDLPLILDLQKFCYRENVRRYNNERILPMMQTLSDIEAEFRVSDYIFLKAQISSQIIGSIRACRRRACGRGAACFIVRLFVHPDYQNRGIGTMLMKTIEERFPDVDRYELFTGYRDEKNIALYTRLGYRKFREEKHDDGMVFYYMEKYRDCP
jgi:GNAT superfamily N-acetyltransferase